MKTKLFKNFKINQLQKIKQTYKYIYIFRYDDLTINEMILIKKNLKQFKFKSLILKQNLIKNIFINIKGQGSVMIIYGNNDINLINNINFLKKIELIYLIVKTEIYSNLKIKKILKNTTIPLNVSIFKPFLTFLYYLRKI
jgi:ribosomal protein L10